MDLVQQYIFHEKQQSRLCAQHCINALLQNSYYGPSELAQLAKELDDEEGKRLSEGGVDNEAYLEFLKADSHNMDNTGFFSVQVIQKALRTWNLEMVPLHSNTNAMAAKLRDNLSTAQAYICNFQLHWFTFRKFGFHWFNLDSTLQKPKPITDTYLTLQLKQLELEGYSIFIIIGELPQCKGDIYFSQNMLPESYLREAATTTSPSTEGQSKDINEEEVDEELQAALDRSYMESCREEQKQIEEAMKQSLAKTQTSPNQK